MSKHTEFIRCIDSFVYDIELLHVDENHHIIDVEVDNVKVEPITHCYRIYYLVPLIKPIYFMDMKLTSDHVEVQFEHEGYQTFHTPEDFRDHLDSLKNSEKLAKRIKSYSLLMVHNT